MSRPIVDGIDARVLPGLICWYRAETVRNKFGDGQGVTYCLDESGNGFHLSSAEGGVNKPPAMVRAGINGYASFSFDSSNAEELRGSMVSAAVTGSFAVVKNSASGNWAGVGSAGFISGMTAGNAKLIGTSGAQTISAPGSASVDGWVNGVNTLTVTNTDVWNLIYVTHTADAVGALVIGRNGSAAEYHDGEIAECGMFTGVPTVAQRTAFFNAIIAKYAITG